MSHEEQFGRVNTGLFTLVISGGGRDRKKRSKSPFQKNRKLKKLCGVGEWVGVNAKQCSEKIFLKM